jgi:hypothetical protein
LALIALLLGQLNSTVLVTSLSEGLASSLLGHGDTIVAVGETLSNVELSSWAVGTSVGGWVVLLITVA